MSTVKHNCSVAIASSRKKKVTGERVRKRNKASSFRCNSRKISGANDDSYPCSLCNKKFTKKWNREAHMRLHSGDKPYECREGCGLRLMWMSSRKSHEVQCRDRQEKENWEMIQGLRRTLADISSDPSALSTSDSISAAKEVSSFHSRTPTISENPLSPFPTACQVPTNLVQPSATSLPSVRIQTRQPGRCELLDFGVNHAPSGAIAANIPSHTISQSFRIPQEESDSLAEQTPCARNESGVFLSSLPSISFRALCDRGEVGSSFMNSAPGQVTSRASNGDPRVDYDVTHEVGCNPSMRSNAHTTTNYDANVLEALGLAHFPRDATIPTELERSIRRGTIEPFRTDSSFCGDLPASASSTVRSDAAATLHGGAQSPDRIYAVLPGKSGALSNPDHAAHLRDLYHHCEAVPTVEAVPYEAFSGSPHFMNSSTDACVGEPWFSRGI